MREGTQIMGALGLGVLAVSSAATFVLLAAPLPSLYIAGGRVAVTAIALLLLGHREARAWLCAVRERPELAARTVLASALLALHFGAWIASLGMTSVLRSTALVAMQPVFAGGLGRLLGDRVSPRLYVGAALSGLGIWVLVGGSAGLESGSILGDALALVGAAAAAGYLALGRSVRSAVPLRAYLGSVHALAGVTLLVVACTVHPDADARALPSGAWLAVLYLGLVPGLIGHGLFNWVVRKVPIDRVSLAILLEPVGATALAWAVLDRAVGGTEMIGAAVVLAGVALGMRGTSEV